MVKLKMMRMVTMMRMMVMLMMMIMVVVMMMDEEGSIREFLNLSQP